MFDNLRLKTRSFFFLTRRASAGPVLVNAGRLGYNASASPLPTPRLQISRTLPSSSGATESICFNRSFYRWEKEHPGYFPKVGAPGRAQARSIYTELFQMKWYKVQDLLIWLATVRSWEGRGETDRLWIKLDNRYMGIHYSSCSTFRYIWNVPQYIF